MLSVILIWLYMIVTAFLLGYGILAGITRFCPYRIQKWDAYLMCGLAGATVYTQFFSIFAPVGLAANLLLAGICLAVAFSCRKKLRKDLQKGIKELCFDREGVRKKIPAKGIFLIILFLLYAYGTSRGIIHYDTGLYHAQSIRWIEEYGVVKGLGNLHCRLAYNSASFALSALYGMAFLGGQSYHAAAGFFALILAAVCSELTGLVKRNYLKASDFARVMGIYYLLIVFDEMISPASDYFMVLTAFYIVIRWMDLLEKKEDAVFPYAMLCVLCVFLLTVKLSAALLILLALKPAAQLLKGKRWKETAVYLGLGIIAAAPFMIRSVLLSGWLVYPLTGIDIFPVDWKIPKGIAFYDAKEIQVWGRGYSDVTKFDMPITGWLPDWFKGLGGMDKLLVLAALASVGVLVLRLVGLTGRIWHSRKGRRLENFSLETAPMGKESEKGLAEEKLSEGILSEKVLPKEMIMEKMLLEFVISVCFLFWLLTSPLIRYGCVYAYLVPAVIWGDMLTEFFQNASHKGKKCRKILEKICISAVGIFLVYKAAAFGREIAASYVNDYWICQKDYDNYETESYEIEGYTFYCPVEGDRTGYDDFPSSPVRAQIGLRGNGLEDGFYYLK